MGKWFLRVLGNIVALGTAAWAASEWGALVPNVIHAGIFFSTTILSALLVFLAGQVYGKLDKILESTEKYDHVRTERAYKNVEAFRRRLTYWFGAAVIALLTCGTAAYVLRDATLTYLSWFVLAGYVGLALVFLTAVRLATGYLSLGGYRLELLSAMDREQKNADDLKALKASAVLPDISTAPAMRVIPRAQ